MNPVQKPAWLIALVVASLMSILFGLIHVSDAIVRLETGSISGETLDGTINPLYAVVFPWRGRCQLEPEAHRIRCSSDLVIPKHLGLLGPHYWLDSPKPCGDW